MTANHFDYIIAGAGCAGLSLAVHMIYSGKLKDKKILLVDQEIKNTNDRTWCFWEKGESLFEPLVKHKWQELLFQSEDVNKKLSIMPFTYKMISGIDFYNYCKKIISENENVQTQNGTIEKIFSNKKGTGIVVNGITISADFIFNSTYQKPDLSVKDYWLLQHFKGWVVETKKNVFNPDVATLMDFRVDQSRGTTFFYVLPFSENKALVEYTIFGKSTLQQDQYDQELKKYLHESLSIDEYKITHEEYGVIPMTNYNFERSNHNIINIGTAGGATKGSTGYTFYFIQKQSEEIVKQLLLNDSPFPLKNVSKKYNFYDSVLLNILYNETLQGKEIFTLLFKKNNPRTILKFLNNESSLPGDLKIISSLPTFPFLKAAIKQVF